jgi:hypothetical protein
MRKEVKGLGRDVRLLTLQGGKAQRQLNSFSNKDYASLRHRPKQQQPDCFRARCNEVDDMLPPSIQNDMG